MRRVLVAVLVAMVGCFPAVAAAAGFSFGDNGAKALSMGGAFAGQADDLTAIQYNPAGLQQLSGFNFLADLSLLNVDVSYQRTDGTSDPAPHAVSNSGGIFPLPFVALGYGTKLGGHRFAAALGVYGPPADGKYQYAQPEQLDPAGDGTYTNDPRKFAPQRYGFISSNTLIAYPSLALSFQPVENLSIGVSLQYVYQDLQFSQAASSQPNVPTSIRTEDPHWDDLIKVHFHGKTTFTGILGVAYRFCDCLQVGASVRPPLVLNSSGTMDITPGYYPAKLGASVQGDSADFQLTLPMEIKLGAHFTPKAVPGLGVNADLVYEGWHRLQAFVLTPKDISLTVGGSTSALGQLTIPKNWQDAYGVRVGGSYQFGFGLSARAGVLFETAAAPNEQTNVDFPNFTRAMITAGVGYPLGPVEVLLTGVYVVPATVTVTSSKVILTDTNCTPAAPCSTVDPIGNGTYTSGGWIAGLGIRGRFGGETP